MPRIKWKTITFSDKVADIILKNSKTLTTLLEERWEEREHLHKFASKLKKVRVG